MAKHGNKARSVKTKFELAVIYKIKALRNEKGMSQDDLAAILDVTRGFIGQIESPNHPAKYNLNHINLIALELECSPKDLIPDKPIL